MKSVDINKDIKNKYIYVMSLDSSPLLSLVFVFDLTKG